LFRLTHGGVYSLIGKEKAERAKAKAKDETTRPRDGKKMVISEK
jgi:hypothetical protein